MHIENYGKVYNLGHREVHDVFREPVVIQEKVDGSQISFGVDDAGQLFVRSRSQALDTSSPGGMFGAAVRSLQARRERMTPGRIYRGEYLARPRQNVLAYDRVPQGNIILFEIVDPSVGVYAWTMLEAEARNLDLEAVPILYTGRVSSEDQLEAMLERVSILGGQKIEGLVIKNYSRRDPITGQYPLKAKLVSQRFREVQTGRHANPKSTSAGTDAALLGAKYRSEARWYKAVQHLRERGQLTGSPQDIGPLMAEVAADLLEEEGEVIREALFRSAWKRIAKEATLGLAEWYKQQLTKSQTF